MNATGYFSTKIIYKQVQFQTVSYILINIQSHLQKLESKLKEIEWCIHARNSYFVVYLETYVHMHLHAQVSLSLSKHQPRFNEYSIYVIIDGNDVVEQAWFAYIWEIIVMFKNVSMIKNSVELLLNV